MQIDVRGCVINAFFPRVARTLVKFLYSGEPDVMMSIFTSFFIQRPMNRFLGIDSANLCSLAGQYDNPIPTQFLAPIDCSKIPALVKAI